MIYEDLTTRELRLEQEERLRHPPQGGKTCAEPHHLHATDERAHRRHHWKERLICMGGCTVLHVVLELISHHW